MEDNVQPTDPVIDASQYQHTPTIPDDSEGKYASLTFTEKMLQIVTDDYANAQLFMDDLHKAMLDAHEDYHNSDKYISIRAEKKFPIPTAMIYVDRFVAKMKRLLFANGRPASFTPMPGTDQALVDAKQEMQDWQDEQDKIRLKFSKLLKDMALSRFCVAALEFKSKSRRKWVTEAAPVALADELTGQPITDETGAFVPSMKFDPATGMEVPETEDRWVLKDIPYYQGCSRKRIDPLNFFFGPEKSEVDDEFPVMVKDSLPKRHFYSQKYFFNQAEIVEGPTDGTKEQDKQTQKRANMGMSTSTASREGMHDYVEWWGMVDRAELYNYLLTEAAASLPEEEIAKIRMKAAEVRPMERCWAVVGVVDGTTVVRLQESPYPFDGPPFVIGVIQPEDDEMAGISIYQKIRPVHKAREELHGMILENIAQVVNAMWIINTSMLAKTGQKVNRAGTILETTGDIDKCVRRVDLQPISPDLYDLDSYYEQSLQDSIGFQDLMNGKGDRAVGTLGEGEIAMSEAMDTIKEYLECVEETLVKPMYRKTNETNMAMIDEEFAYMVTGTGEWKTIDPSQVRADVDILCEASSKEARRAVLNQQRLQALEISPIAGALGICIRVDRIQYDTWLDVFGEKEEKVLRYFPLIKLEKEHPELNVDMMLFEAAMAQIGANQAMLMQQTLNPAGNDPGQEQTTQGKANISGRRPMPLTEGEASQSANAQSRPNVRSMMRQ